MSNLPPGLWEEDIPGYDEDEDEDDFDVDLDDIVDELRARYGEVI